MGLLFGRGRSRSILRHIPIVRWIGPAVTLAGILAAAYSVLTGRIDLTALDQYRGVQPPAAVQPVNLESLGDKSDQTIRLATFNIQVFGDSKSSDAEVMPQLAKIVLQFDVVAIQEIRAQTSLPVERLVELVNRSGGRYRAVTSEPIGRTRTKEAYAFIWDEARVQWEPDSAYVVRDDNDRMHREPMVATFQARTASSDGRRPFRFTLINVHTDPDEVRDLASSENELNVLDDVFHRVREYEYRRTGQTDVILLGDLNAPADGLGELSEIPNLASILGDVPTNTRGTKTYDHILIDQEMTREFTGRAGVVDFVRDLKVGPELALRISDHLPVWGEFSAYQVDESILETAAATPTTASR